MAGCQTGAAAPGYRLRVDTPDTLAVSVVMAPHHSVFSLLAQVGTGHSLGAPAGLLAGIGKGLRPRARLAVQPFAVSCYKVIPECGVPIPPLADTSVAEQASRLKGAGAGSADPRIGHARRSPVSAWLADRG